MGCDIHSIAQVKQNGQWVTVDNDIAGDLRNYRTFGCLVGIRYYSVTPLDNPRGLPSDIKLDENGCLVGYTTKDGIDVWMGDHSHSYYTLKELIEYVNDVEKNKSTKIVGYLEEDEYRKVAGTENIPNEYYSEGDDDVNNYTVLTPKEYRQASTLPREFLIEYTWYESDVDFTNLKEIITDLKDIATTHKVGVEDVRYVFGFDS